MTFRGGGGRRRESKQRKLRGQGCKVNRRGMVYMGVKKGKVSGREKVYIVWEGNGVGRVRRLGIKASERENAHMGRGEGKGVWK